MKLLTTVDSVHSYDTRRCIVAFRKF